MRFSRRLVLVLQLAEACGALHVARIMVFMLPFRRLVAVVGRPALAIPNEPVDSSAGRLQRAAGVARLLEKVAPYIGGRTTCLVCATALHLMLRRRHIPCTLRVGVRTSRDGLAAHAWILVEGKVILGGDVGDYTPFFDMGRPPGSDETLR